MALIIPATAYAEEFAYVSDIRYEPPIVKTKETKHEDRHMVLIERPRYTETHTYYQRYDNDFMRAGVIEDGDVAYTWYSQNVLPGGGLDELNANGRHVDESGFIRDADGYIAVASSDYGIGEIVSTPWGEAKVYDTGCDSGVIDVYTDF